MLAACGVGLSLPAQEKPAASAVASTGKAELDQLLTEYEAQEKALDVEIEPLLKEAHNKYSGELEAQIEKLNQSKRAEEADKVKKEVKRFAEKGLNSEPDKDTSAELRANWGAYVKATAAANQSVTLKRNAARVKFTQALTPLVQGYRAKNDAEGITLARRAHAAITIRSLIDTGKTAVAEHGEIGKDSWQDVAREGGYVVGFDGGKGGWFQFEVLGGLQPIFATARGLRDGEKRGGSSGTRLMAKEGYAVGGLQVRGGAVINCVQIMFMRINPDGVSLNQQDFYTTDWIGGAGGGKPKELTTRGRMVIGVTGRTGGVVESIGLVHLK